MKKIIYVLVSLVILLTSCTTQNQKKYEDGIKIVLKMYENVFPNTSHYNILETYVIDPSDEEANFDYFLKIHLDYKVYNSNSKSFTEKNDILYVKVNKNGKIDGGIFNSNIQAAFEDEWNYSVFYAYKINVKNSDMT